MRAAMPFQGSRPAPPPSTPVEPPSRKPAPRSELDETSAFHGLPDLGTVLPFGPSAPPSRPPEPAPVSRPAPRELTFEEYASFCAARAQAPGHAAALAVRFGVGTSEACAALDAVWRARAERDRALSSALAARIAEYRAWLEAERARGRLP
ncbi:MAG: hypothetical protein HY908_21300 [Myxococcales bacterium]|nr:hypothetical protein [Myxococcales bacterium]